MSTLEERLSKWREQTEGAKPSDALLQKVNALAAAGGGGAAVATTVAVKTALWVKVAIVAALAVGGGVVGFVALETPPSTVVAPTEKVVAPVAPREPAQPLVVDAQAAPQRVQPVNPVPPARELPMSRVGDDDCDAAASRCARTLHLWNQMTDRYGVIDFEDRPDQGPWPTGFRLEKPFPELESCMRTQLLKRSLQWVLNPELQKPVNQEGSTLRCRFSISSAFNPGVTSQTLSEIVSVCIPVADARPPMVTAKVSQVMSASVVRVSDVTVLPVTLDGPKRRCIEQGLLKLEFPFEGDNRPDFKTLSSTVSWFRAPQKVPTFDAGVPTVAAVPGAVDALLADVADASEKKDLERARLQLEACLRIDPRQLVCIRKLASTMAKIGTRDGSQEATEQARALYERYLNTAPDDDPYVPKIRNLFSADK